MRLLATLLILGGYTLVYAAVAKSGKFALEPWSGLLSDAYMAGVAGSTSGGASAGAAGSSAPAAPASPSPGMVVRPRGSTGNAAAPLNPTFSA